MFLRFLLHRWKPSPILVTSRSPVREEHPAKKVPAWGGGPDLCPIPLGAPAQRCSWPSMPTFTSALKGTS
uniref:hypothetical protein n=1 Tax=Nitrospira cf. moscoviensis SBR1015 TaxID=96242 RepID=UPI00117FE347|nr:hypothetical protein [Nitrospira cf. moscoviensis SBR1015]